MNLYRFLFSILQCKISIWQLDFLKVFCLLKNEQLLKTVSQLNLLTYSKCDLLGFLLCCQTSAVTFRKTPSTEAFNDRFITQKFQLDELTATRNRHESSGNHWPGAQKHPVFFKKSSRTPLKLFGPVEQTDSQPMIF